MKKFLEFYIYSSIHIAVCVACFTACTYLTINQPIDVIYCIFIFASTWLLYSLHKIIGINKVSDDILDERFEIVRKYRQHIKVHSIIAFIAAICSFFLLPNTVKLLVLAPSCISLLYIVPIFINGKRLRDFNYIKIFLVAFSYGVLCAAIPAYMEGYSLSSSLLLGLEKSAFIFAITLPFDYRDRKVDEISNVKTISQIFENHLPILIVSSYIVSLVLLFVNVNYTYDSRIFIGILYGVLLFITLKYYDKENDYYISGILDGTMILTYVGLMIHQIIFHLPISYSL